MKSREDGIMMASGVPVAVCHIIMAAWAHGNAPRTGFGGSYCQRMDTDIQAWCVRDHLVNWGHVYSPGVKLSTFFAGKIVTSKMDVEG